jgi:hypothetical protein
MYIAFLNTVSQENSLFISLDKTLIKQVQKPLKSLAIFPQFLDPSVPLFVPRTALSQHLRHT